MGILGLNLTGVRFNNCFNISAFSAIVLTRILQSVVNNTLGKNNKPLEAISFTVSEYFSHTSFVMNGGSITMNEQAPNRSLGMSVGLLKS